MFSEKPNSDMQERLRMLKMVTGEEKAGNYKHIVNLKIQIEQRKKDPGCLGYVGDEILFPVFFEIIIHHCKDPVIKQPVWLMESIRLFLLLLLNFLWFSSVFLIDGIFFLVKTPVFVEFHGIFSGEKTSPFVLQEQCCFYKAATVAFIFTGFICIAIWIPWAATTEAQGSIGSIHRDRVAVTDWWNPGGNLLYIGDERMKS